MSAATRETVRHEANRYLQGLAGLRYNNEGSRKALVRSLLDALEEAETELEDLR